MSANGTPWQPSFAAAILREGDFPGLGASIEKKLNAVVLFWATFAVNSYDVY